MGSKGLAVRHALGPTATEVLFGTWLYPRVMWCDVKDIMRCVLGQAEAASGAANSRRAEVL
jgi:hypothetical protein